MSRDALEIPGDPARDKRLRVLAEECGFGTPNRLIAHVAYEIAHVKSPAVYYRAMANFFELSRKKKARR